MAQSDLRPGAHRRGPHGSRRDPDAGPHRRLIGYLKEAEANHILGSDPFAVEDLTRRMKYGDYGRAGEIVMSGIAVVEMACWDIKGKALGVPVWQLLGGKVTDKVKAYANGWYTTERTPEAYHKAAQEVVARGYKALKIDPFGTGHFELDHAAPGTPSPSSRPSGTRSARTPN